MNRLRRILWSLLILFIIVMAITFTFGIILVGGTIAGIYGTYRYYLFKKKLRNLKVWPNRFSSGEIIEMPKEIHNHSNFRKK